MASWHRDRTGAAILSCGLGHWRPARSPKNISIARSLYDGQGGLSEPGETIEAHLAKIESAASVAIRKFAATKIGEGGAIPPEISRFLAWQAARTPGWMELVQQWADEPPFDPEHEVVEPPPPGFEKIRNRMRPMCLEDPNTGARREVTVEEEFHAYRKQGWKWIIRREDHLEMLHIQAWYFQVRHFPRLSWARLQPPDNEVFITSDRSAAWLADGYADTPPAALRHPTAQVVAPLTRKVALVGRHGGRELPIGLLIVIVLGGAIEVWQLIGIWRSASKHTERGGRRVWAFLAQIGVIVGWGKFIKGIFELFGLLGN